MIFLSDEDTAPGQPGAGHFYKGRAMTVIPEHVFETVKWLQVVLKPLQEEGNMIDGGLRKLFREKITEGVQWTSVETGSTSQGVPDCEYCFAEGKSGWIEFKLATANKVNISPFQVAWVEERVRMGGAVWLIVRYKANQGVRREPEDSLHMYCGNQIRDVSHKGLKLKPHSEWDGGPSKWGWLKIEELLKGKRK